MDNSLEARPDENRFRVGSNWTAVDGQRTIVIDAELTGANRVFAVVNAQMNWRGYISIGGLQKGYRYVGYDPAYKRPVA